MEKFNKKAPNFKQNDKDELVGIIKKYLHLVENKKTDAVSLKQKYDAWEQITLEFNSRSFVQRNSNQIKTLYKNMKRNLKQDLALDKANIFKTGGGTFVRKVNEDNPLLHLVGESCSPLPNPFDSSAEYYNDYSKEYGFETETAAIISTAATITSAEGAVIPATITSAEAEVIPAPAKSATASPFTATASPLTATASSSTKTASNILPSISSSSSKKRKSNRDVRLFVEEFSELKKKKIESQIETQKSKKKMYDEITEYIRLKKEKLKK